MKTYLNLRLRLKLNRQCSKGEISEILIFIADHLLDVDELYQKEFGSQETKLKIEHHFLSQLRSGMRTSS